MVKRIRLPKIVLLAAFVVSAAMITSDAGAEENPCLECHEDPDFSRDDGEDGDLYVDEKALEHSVHSDLDCADCHQSAELVDGEHEPDLDPVDCSECHDSEASVYAGSGHGQALARGDEQAPHCWDCHGTHEILPPTDRASHTYKINIPAVCSQCHSEGKPVARTHEFASDRVVENYSMSIHGVGVFKRGLTVAAVCTDCHGSHNVLPHTNPESTIHHEKVASTCMTCHAEIERVHVKVIGQHLWQDRPQAIPACIDCHAPHEIRRVQYQQSFTDTECLSCHGKQDIMGERDGQPVSMYVDAEEVHGSAHVKATCVMCHSNVSRTDERPCKHVGKVDCAACHAETVDMFKTGIHGRLLEQGNPNAPSCTLCHGDHGVLSHKNAESPINVRNIPDLCARCHREGERAAKLYEGKQHEIIEHYRMSIHGKGLLESGLLVTAVCTNCHTSHRPLPAKDPESSVNRENIGQTCGNCHAGIYERFSRSVHSPSVTKTDKKLPACNDCHSSHTIERVDKKDFRTEILDRCGNCHKELTEAYFDTYHGKVSLLGAAKSAKCADCHSAHEILPPTDPKSTLHRDNIVKTCGVCHEGSHRRFAGYLTHATHKDPDKYPVIYYTFWFMTLLLLGTLGFFTLHTLMWFPHSLRLMLRRRKERKEHGDEPYVRRFVPYHRITHLLVILSFFALAITGMMLKFSYAEWAQFLSSLMGGFETAGSIHRFAALVTFFYFGMHLFFLWRQKREQGVTWRKYLFHGESAVPNLRDLKEFGQTIKWFLGRGERPDYGRFTYWEKFDYFAVFWGVAVIGVSGLMLWFPEQFTWFLPGWMINVATIIHSDEALLAAGFIFTIHFFNTHFRPERFPMDPVIFTGAVPLSEFKEERPREYRQAVESGQLESMFVPKPSRRFEIGARVFGLTALLTGLTLIALIVYAMFFAYR